LLQLDRLDRASGIALHRQIADILRDVIRSNQLSPGQRLPSEAELIEHFGVARMTVRQALQQLQSEGLVVAVQGRGVFVRPSQPIRRLTSDRFMRRRHARGQSPVTVGVDKSGSAPQVDSIVVSRENPTPVVAQRLRLSVTDDVIVRSRRYLANGRPLETAVSYIPAACGEGTELEQADAGAVEIYTRLEENGHALGRVTEEVGARMPSPEERRALRIGAGVPVLTVLRTAYDTNGLPVEVRVSVKVSWAFLLEYQLPIH
jgi:GntR family transcriptional regulator